GGGYGGGSGHMTDKDWGQVVREDMRTLEDRLARQNELSEARINKAVDEIKEDFKDLKTEFKEVRADIKESKKYNLGILLTIVGMFITVIAFGVATLLSVASLVK
ncbi:hypothetical protein LJC07_08620, partial [Christensenellaceae bacterium OttesenSCG-928-L17]|nr:hypothetical protein [Christensenellaceae bacterium OttesenSCG-928-L17]